MIKWLKSLIHHWHLKSIADATTRDAVRAHQKKVLDDELAKTLYLGVQNNPVPAPVLNHRRLANGCWLLRTQAGFMQACRAENPKLSRKEIRNAVNAWPREYPAVVRISKYHGYIDVTALHVDQYRAKTKALLDDLAGE